MGKSTSSVITLKQAQMVTDRVLSQLTGLPDSPEHWPETYMAINDPLGVGSQTYYCGWLFDSDLDLSPARQMEIISVGQQGAIFNTVAQFLEKWKVARVTFLGATGIQSVMVRIDEVELLNKYALGQTKGRLRAIAVGRNVYDERSLRVPMRGGQKVTQTN